MRIKNGKEVVKLMEHLNNLDNVKSRLITHINNLPKFVEVNQDGAMKIFDKIKGLLPPGVLWAHLNKNHREFFINKVKVLGKKENIQTKIEEKKND